MTPSRLLGAKRGEEIADLPVPSRFVQVPEGTPAGPPFNVAHLYTRYADAVRGGHRVDPDFEVAARRQRLLDAMERASDEGRTVRLD
jgi:predicted dehydrogenase